MTKKAKKKLKGLVTAQEFDAHQSKVLDIIVHIGGRTSPAKNKPPMREDSSYTLDSLLEQPFKKKNLPNSSRRSRNKQEGAGNQYKTEVLTKKKAVTMLSQLHRLKDFSTLMPLLNIRRDSDIF